MATKGLTEMQEAFNRMREEYASNALQISEIHRMMADMSIKIDLIANSIDGAAAAAKLSKPAKKTVVKATPVESAEVEAEPTAAPPAPPAKRVVKKAAPKVAEHVEEAPAAPAPPVKKTVKKAAPKVAEHVEDATESTPAPPVKKPTKKAAPKTAEEAPAATPVKSATNKMLLFTKALKEDPNQFDHIFNDEVLEEIDEKIISTRPNCVDTTEFRPSAMYHYLKDNHPEVLDGLKKN